MNAMLIEETTENFVRESIPPAEIVTDGDPVSKTWVADNFQSAGSVSTGIWTAKPGTLKIESYPVDEVFTVLSGKIEVVNDDASVVIVSPGQTCRLRKGWSGLFRTVEQTRKCFVTIGEQ